MHDYRHPVPSWSVYRKKEKEATVLKLPIWWYIAYLSKGLAKSDYHTCKHFAITKLLKKLKHYDVIAIIMLIY